MKKIYFSVILLCNVVVIQAQNLQGMMVFSHHNDTSTVHPDTIYSINNARQKTFVTFGYRPRVSHNGNYMAFANGQNPNQSLYASVWIRNLLTRKDTLILFNGGDYIDYFDFSPADSQLSYDYGCSLYTTNINGTNSYHNIGCDPCDCYSDQPDVRLADSMIVYHNVHYGIYSKNYDGSNLLKIPHTYPGDLDPVWSPDGLWIGYYKTRGYYIPNAIYKIKPDGSDSTLLLKLGLTDTLTPDLTWTSDMQNIYFIGRIQNELGIYSLRTDGSGNYQKFYALDNSLTVNDYWMGVSDFISGTLPLTLIDFNALYQNKTIHIVWQTTKEINSSYFEIERSSNATNFSKIASIFSKENNNTVADYSFTDTALPYINARRESLLYRLKIVDKDGRFTYSKIVSVNFSSSSSIKIYPNPAVNMLRIEGLNSSVFTTISIVDVSGNIVKKVTVKKNSYLYDVRNLSAGIYYTSIAEGKNVTSLKFTKR